MNPPLTHSALRTQALDGLRTLVDAQAAVYLGLAQVGGQLYVTDPAISAPESWGVSSDALNGIAARRYIDLTTLWETVENRRFGMVTSRVLRRGPRLLNGEHPPQDTELLAAALHDDTHLRGIVLLWPKTTDIPSLTAPSAKCEPLFEQIWSSLPACHRCPSTHVAVLSAMDGTLVDADHSPDHPLRADLDLFAFLQVWVTELNPQAQVFTTTRHNWRIRLHRIGHEHVALRLVPLHAVPVPVTAALTPQQRRVTTLVIEGLSSAQIAEMLQIQAQTVRSHLKRVFKRLNVRNRTQLANRLRAARL